MNTWDYFHAHILTSAIGLTALVPLVRFVLHVLVFKVCREPLLSLVFRRVCRRSSPFSSRARGRHSSQPFGTRVLAVNEQQRRSGKLPPKANHRRKKLTESLWKLTVYSTLLSIGTRALWGRPWALETKEWWRGGGVELYYNAELAFYGASMFMLLLWEERRHDFLVMLTHHLVTIFLISFSYYAGFTRIGAMVMLLHDPSDIFLETAKLCQYLGFEAAATFFFAALLCSWFLLRLVVFPFWLIRSAMFESPSVLGQHPPYSFAFIAMLCTLVTMHVYWFALIARIAWIKITTGDTRDTREDED